MVTCRMLGTRSIHDIFADILFVVSVKSNISNLWENEPQMVSVTNVNIKAGFTRSRYVYPYINHIQSPIGHGLIFNAQKIIDILITLAFYNWKVIVWRLRCSSPVHKQLCPETIICISWKDKQKLRLCGRDKNTNNGVSYYSLSIGNQLNISKGLRMVASASWRSQARKVVPWSETLHEP